MVQCPELSSPTSEAQTPGQSTKLLSATWLQHQSAIIVAFFLSQQLSTITYTLFLLSQEKLKESWWEQKEPQSQLRLDSSEVKKARPTFLLHPASTFPVCKLAYQLLDLHTV